MEYNSGSPIYLQVINELKKKMVKGELKPGEKMPSNRERRESTGRWRWQDIVTRSVESVHLCRRRSICLTM